ncbi:uncharacterized protein LOC113305155 [Papaver somniferum]|uniref:uncharacterized protein LOC113305155 n=1 Tax=Papaver somniferum TaxID=3469 RepID=UPI000E6F8523|nr:uncharacterized protein LOC113305155 [Papaver somniferum]
MEKKIKTWTEKWIPENVIPVPREDFLPDLNQKVSDLINSNCTWKLNMLTDMFDDNNVQLIKLIEPNNVGDNDNIKWIGTRDGEVSVKSAYNYLCNRNHLNVKVDWIGIWKLKVIPRVQMSLWKACSDCVPVKDELGRHIPIDTQCILCNKLVSETTYHLFLNCHFAEGVWRGMSLSTVFYNGKSIYFKDWCVKWLKDKDNKKVYAYVLWFLWKYRCRVAFDGIKLNLVGLIEKIKTELKKFINTSNNGNDKQRSSSKNSCDCFHPNCKFGKDGYTCSDPHYIMFDASFNKSNLNFAYAAVLLDCNGAILNFAGGTGRCTSSEEAESRACREATRWAKDAGVDSITFLNDNLNVINGIKRKNFAVNWRSEAFIPKALENTNSFASSSFFYIKRNCNYIADSLAKYFLKCGLSEIDSRNWSKDRKKVFFSKICNINNVCSFA